MPQYSYVDLEDTLPKKFSNLSVEGADYKLDGTKLIMDNVQVLSGCIKEIKVSFLVEEVQQNTIETSILMK